MEIRLAKIEDLSRLMELYDAARAFMRSRGNSVQWVGGYPSREVVSAGIESGDQYVCVAGGDNGRDGRIVATFWFAVAPEPTYAVIHDGAWLTEGPFEKHPYGVVHRLASDGSVRGVGAFCLDWCLGRCGNVRVDTHADNSVMQSLLVREGYKKCGMIFIADGTPRDAFQKLY
jgi:hypothetical protein